jgi:hypothetical protein
MYYEVIIQTRGVSMKKITILTWVMVSLFGLTPLARAEVLNMPEPSEPAAVTPPPEPAPAPAPENVPAPAPAPDSVQESAPETAPTAAPETAPATVTETTSTTVPGRGMHMDQVEARFGSPREKIPAVGEPPITRWVYSNYTVYFERDIVIDSVLHHN